MPLSPLPIDDALPQLLATLRKSASAVLVAPPGAGKTTRVPPAMIAAGLLSRQYPNLVMLQPRRVAARAAAKRIADEQGWTVGNEVGYHVRFDRKIARHTRIRVLTEGILTRQLLDDPGLEGIGAVLLDEFHERSLHTDIAIALLREVQESLRPDLKLLVMSATLAAEPVARFLDDAPIVRSEGRMFPIRTTYRAVPMPSAVDEVPSAVAELLNAPTDDGGDILVFLPGMEEIRRASAAIKGSLLINQNQKISSDSFLVLPLHGSLTAEEQDVALRPSGQRKVILATNIAETSLTIEGVTSVIDTGLARLASYDAERGLDRLDLTRISRASADQRAGRAGRTAPGRCIRLWSEKEHHALAAFGEPEIRRVDLAGTALSLHAWGVNPRTFGWFEEPSESSLNTAEELLEMLGALNVGWASPTSSQPVVGGARPTVNHAISALGKRMVDLPMHPRLARLLVAAQDASLTREGATLAAMLSEKDVLPFEPDRSARRANVVGDSDVLYRLQRLESGDRSLDHAAVKAVNAARHQFLQSTERRSPSPGTPGEGGGEGSASSASNLANQKNPHPNPLPAYQARGSERSSGEPSRSDSKRLPPHPSPLSSGEREPDILKLILLAYPDRVCKRRPNDPTQAVMVGGGGVRIGVESIVASAELFVAIDARHDHFSRQQQAVVRLASRIESAWLEELFPQSIRRETTAEFDEARGKVVGVRRTLYRDLPLREDIDTSVTDERAARVLADVLRPKLESLLKEDEHLAPLVARLQLMSAHLPEHAWPQLGSASGDSSLAKPQVESDWLVDAFIGVRTLDDAKRRLPQALRDQLVYPLDRLLEQHAPESVEVPTGNRIKIDYRVGQRPVLAVRLQEVFGWLDTPRIANGKVPLLMHLLGPNYRPVQITDDLRSFWSTTYFQVRKDLKVRYPKHSWPDDPLTAVPVAKGRSQRK